MVGRGNLPAKHLQYLNLEQENASLGDGTGINNSGVVPQENGRDVGVTINESGNKHSFFT